MALPGIKLLLLFFFNTAIILAQQIEKDEDIFRSSDPLLYNGKIYLFYPPPATEGNQFLSDRQFMPGSVKLRGVVYFGLLINYDIYNQQLILKYITPTGAALQIIISEAWLESFSLNARNFELIATGDQKKIFQVIGGGPYRILYRWKKKLELNHFLGSTNRVFSKPRREMNLDRDSLILNYKNNKSFCSLFEADARSEIRDYLRKQKIRVRKADDKSISGLISFCNSLKK